MLLDLRLLQTLVMLLSLGPVRPYKFGLSHPACGSRLPLRPLPPPHSAPPTPSSLRSTTIVGATDRTAFAVSPSTQQGCHPCSSCACVWSVHARQQHCAVHDNPTLHVVCTPHPAAALRHLCHQQPQPRDLHACLSRFARQGQIGRRVQIVCPT